MSKLATLCCLVLMSLAIRSQATSIVVNGGFDETPYASGWSYCTGTPYIHPVDGYLSPCYEGVDGSPCVAFAGPLYGGESMLRIWQECSVEPGRYRIDLSACFRYEVADAAYLPENLAIFGRESGRATVDILVDDDLQANPYTGGGWPNVATITGRTGWYSVSASATQWISHNLFVIASLEPGCLYYSYGDENGPTSGYIGDTVWVDSISVELTRVPEPSSILALLCGIGGLALPAWRRRFKGL